MNRRAPMAIRVNTARITREELIGALAEEHVIAQPTRAGAGRAGARDARQRLRPVGVPRRAVRGDGRGQPAGRRAGGAAAGGPRASTPARAPAARRWRWAAALGGQGAGAGARHRRQEAGGAAPPRPPRRADQRRGASRCATIRPRVGEVVPRRLRPRAGRRALLGAGDAAPQPRGALAAHAARRSRRSRRASWRCWSPTRRWSRSAGASSTPPAPSRRRRTSG